ncbi:MAG: peptidoglycan-binding protein LysM, partial [Saprospiraceae bacterium]|nr:peptidoglycan-binding protein LysM [Saprospiraceae bacterium]
IVYGQCDTQADKEKVILTVGNVDGIGYVDDRLEVLNPEEDSQFHEVQSGDTLSKIAKHYYGDAMKYPVIFEANQPMLTNPDLIYPGQVLRIPPIA